MTDTKKSKLISISMPWSIAVDETFLKMQLDDNGFPQSVTFVGCFRNHDDEGGLIYAEDPGEFRKARDDERTFYQLVRVNFWGARGSGWHERFDQAQSIDLRRYDLSEYKFPMPDPKKGESLDTAMDKYLDEFRKSGLIPDSRMYKIGGSKTLQELAPNNTDLNHYLFLGSERNLSIIAEGWDWELGQPT